ncbi:MAG TPA: molybdate ABC transporter substrate-binding protein [Candidatus Dormibacteraeota bacterium]|nr:molybdate ABC transporter substrate-binding protein [Candidatus Dormibacteraeota bacterium]
MTRKAPALFAVALVLAACGTASNGNSPKASAITVFAAASLQPPFDRIGRQLKSSQNLTTTFSYAGTQTLTAQLQQGAQADVFASADTTHMTTLQSGGLIAGAPTVFAHNRLEIAVAKGNPKGIHTLADLARSGLVVVLADPSVPAGKYAAQALARAGVKVKPASLELQVTAVLNKVALGEADAGIVYVSDIVTSGKVDGVAIPDNQNVIAVYPIAALKTAQNSAGSMTFITFLLSSGGQAILKSAGFAPA